MCGAKVTSFCMLLVFLFGCVSPIRLDYVKRIKDQGFVIVGSNLQLRPGDLIGVSDTLNGSSLGQSLSILILCRADAYIDNLEVEEEGFDIFSSPFNSILLTSNFSLQKGVEKRLESIANKFIAPDALRDLRADFREMRVLSTGSQIEDKTSTWERLKNKSACVDSAVSRVSRSNTVCIVHSVVTADVVYQFEWAQMVAPSDRAAAIDVLKYGLSGGEDADHITVESDVSLLSHQSTLGYRGVCLEGA